ncbi:UDP-N-acetylglucosamine 2-epimerase (non-hydrolyzing), partial [bacterium]|nr:UDP-N-acetylglucosamine 2-epimerase (non-hydrolyzing) [bacterium]
MKRHRCAIVIGTRPEAIKMAPIVAALKADSLIEPVVVVTGQHDELMAPVLRFFELEADFKLNVLVPGQSLALLNSRLLSMLDGVVRDKQIDSVMVQGDTTSAMAGATVGFYHRLPVFHVEAGLRTNDIYAPFPEEFNRRVIDQVATLKFPPTEIALQNLEKDGLQANSIVVGNSVIDALLLGLRLIDERGQERYNAWMNGIGFQAGRRRILVTTHRRENIGEPLLNICRALRTLSDRYPDLEIALPVHKNPAFFSV